MGRLTGLPEQPILTRGLLLWLPSAGEVSILTLILATVFGPLQTFLKTTSLDARQWPICTGLALTIVVAEIRKAVRRNHPQKGDDSRG